MKHSCEVIKDLIPLYVDNACSEESAKCVEEHTAECSECKNLLESMKMPIKTDTSAENRSMEKSLKKVRKKIKTKNIIFLIIGCVLMFILIRYIIPPAAVIGFLIISSVSSKPVTVTDEAQYSDCIGTSADSEYGIDPEEHTLFKVFPESIEGDVLDFEYTYYNPFDPQYVSYMRVKYNDDKYNEELERLTKKGINEKYKDYYSVTGEPEGYDLVSMNADSYYGFGYSIIPETEDNTITYVGIHFCNYFLDLDINEYIPEEYLLEGFNAEMDNPYEKKRMGK